MLQPLRVLPGIRFLALTLLLLRVQGELRVDQAHRGYTTSTDAAGFATLNPLYMTVRAPAPAPPVCPFLTCAVGVWPSSAC